MRNHYHDIIDRIEEEPTWFDDYGVPRYCDFSPKELSNIYSKEAALAEISCQGCGRLFHVALNSGYAKKGRSLSDEIRLGHLHYGDPPNVACCSGGSSMNSIMHRVLEYWSRDFELHFEWTRDATFEGPVTEKYEPVDAVQEVFAAIDVGQRNVCVDCTSGRDRYDIAGRVTVIAAGRGSVLVTCPHQIISVVHGSLKDVISGCQYRQP